MTRDELETALDRGRLQIKSVNGGKWYDIRRNGQTKTWKRTPSKVEIPCKVGFKECFRLAGSHNGMEWQWDCHVRVRPDDFDPRTRA